MNAYPIFYVILSIPGIANRLVEAWGGTSKILQLMQASIQYVGLANAITYGWNERIWCSLRRGLVAHRCLRLDLRRCRIYLKGRRVGQKISLDFPVATFRVSGLEECASCWRFYFSIFLVAFYTSWWSVRSPEL